MNEEDDLNPLCIIFFGPTRYISHYREIGFTMLKYSVVVSRRCQTLRILVAMPRMSDQKRSKWNVFENLWIMVYTIEHSRPR